MNFEEKIKFQPVVEKFEVGIEQNKYH